MRRAQLTSSSQGILEADIECRIFQTCKNRSRLARNISWSAVVVPNRVFDLVHRLALNLLFQHDSLTYVHVHHLAISSVAADGRCHHNQSISVHKIAYATLILRAVSGLGDQVESQGESGQREKK
jgi:hypothetical protein